MVNAIPELSMVVYGFNLIPWEAEARLRVQDQPEWPRKIPPHTKTTRVSLQKAHHAHLAVCLSIAPVLTGSGKGGRGCRGSVEFKSTEDRRISTAWMEQPCLIPLLQAHDGVEQNLSHGCWFITEPGVFWFTYRQLQEVVCPLLPSTDSELFRLWRDLNSGLCVCLEWQVPYQFPIYKCFKVSL